MITGAYNELGYEIYRDNIEIYRAGNCRYDSYPTVAVEDGLPLQTIERFCKQTARELADEHNDTVGNISYQSME